MKRRIFVFTSSMPLKAGSFIAFSAETSHSYHSLGGVIDAFALVKPRAREEDSQVGERQTKRSVSIAKQRGEKKRGGWSDRQANPAANELKGEGKCSNSNSE